MDSSLSTYVVDVVNVSGGLPSSGGLRDMDGRILAQYINPRPYMSVSNSSAFFVGLGIVSGLGLLALGAYCVYDLVSDHSSHSVCVPASTERRILSISRKKDGKFAESSLEDPLFMRQTVVSDDLLIRKIHTRVNRLQDDDCQTLAT